MAFKELVKILMAFKEFTLKKSARTSSFAVAFARLLLLQAATLSVMTLFRMDASFSVAAFSV